MNIDAPLVIEDICKSFGKSTVLNKVSLLIPAKQMFGLIGLNGIGKTTLIKMILDLITPDSGSITLFGVPHYLPAAREKLAYLPEKFSPSPLLTGWEFLELSQSSYKQPLDRERAEQLCRDLDLNPEVLPNKVKKYSKGMGQKLGLVSIFLSNAPLLLLDEPMSGLDPRARICLKNLLKKAVAEGRTVFFSSHILADIDEICDTIGIIHEQKLVFFGTPQNFKEPHPGQSLEEIFLEAIAS